MTNVKKNNKGFSLVELIVVVLIMAIIAVAMAPQVMKWVDNARIGTDVSTYDSMVANCQLALTDADTYDALYDATTAVTVKVSLGNSGVTFDPAIATGNASAALDAQLKAIMDANYATNCKSKVSGKTYVITITNGVVSRTTPPVTTGTDLE